MEAITREEIFLAKIIGETVPDIEPITRKELFLAKAAGMDVQTPEPITREEMFLSQIPGGSGGGAAPVIEPLTVTENGTYTAPSGVDGYNPVTVNVASLSDSEWEEQCIGIVSGSYLYPVSKLPDRIDKIRPYMFYNHGKLLFTSLPDTVVDIGMYAFAESNCQIATLPLSLKYIGERAFVNCNKVTIASLPDRVENINSYCFANCENITISALPKGLIRIGDYGFSGCSQIAITVIPDTVTTIGSNAFKACTSITEITFQGTPTTINHNAFNSCTNLLAINVPWAEGEVAYAPWGATNATINYNYTGG